MSEVRWTTHGRGESSFLSMTMPRYNTHTFQVPVGPLSVVPYGASVSVPHHPHAVLSTKEEPCDSNLLTLNPSPTPSNASSVAHPTRTSTRRFLCLRPLSLLNQLKA